jgi:hypothetical protein
MAARAGDRDRVELQVAEALDHRLRGAARGPLAATDALTLAIADWVREVIWAAVDHDASSPEALLKELTWERRHLFQSSGLYARMPWKIM